MPAIIKSEDLPKDAVHDLLSSLELPEADQQLARLWAATVDGWSFDRWRGLEEPVAWYSAGRERTHQPSHRVLSDALEGRIFAPSGELRWRVIPALGEHPFRTVFIGHVDWLPGRLGESRPVESLDGEQFQCDKRTEALLLWGSHWQENIESEAGDAPHTWMELQIPHRIAYPIDSDADRLKLEVEVWSDQTGEPHFVRFCDLLRASQ